MEDDVMRRIVRWAGGREDVRAVILTSTRAREGASVDAWSDYDVILYATDPAPLLGDGGWAAELGAVLVQMPPRGQEHAWGAPTRLVLYEDGTRIDFTVLDAGVPATLSEELDAGYRVLLDKDGVTAALPAPSGAAYVLRQPTQEEFGAVVEEFWWETTYMAKNLARGEPLPAKYSLDCVLKLDLLRRMLEWRVAIDHGWTYRPGVLGRGLKAHLSPERWNELEQGDLWRTIALFRAVAVEVARELGLEYPHRLDARMTEFLGAPDHFS